MKKISKFRNLPRLLKQQQQHQKTDQLAKMNDQQEEKQIPNGFNHNQSLINKDDIRNYIAKHDYEYVMIQRQRTKRKSYARRSKDPRPVVISSNLSTDKDSGMGSPVEVDSSRLTTLHEKDQHFVDIEEEQQPPLHEWDKKYLLKTYLNSMEMTKTQATEHNIDGYDDLQLHWLHRIYAINKQIQRKEEQILRLHAKVRRHQVKYAFQTKSDVLVQIDRLDTELATQATNIHRIENQLFTANEELKEKLGILETLGHEFETTLIDIQNWGTLV